MDNRALAPRFEVAEAVRDHGQTAATGIIEPIAGERGSVGTLVLLAPPSLRVIGFYERIVKRLLDILICVTCSVVVLPLLFVIGVALYVTMGSPVIFCQQRVGLNGKVFTILKFRTMIPDRRKNVGGYYGPERRQRHKSPNDPRVTPIGRFLRKWSLDELPQFWNVLRGEMTLVGPRPELLEIVQQYQPWQHRRHDVKPGLTGLWQVSGLRDGLMHEHVELDLDYIEQMSFKTDMWILFRTAAALMGKSLGC
jgi:lipopolysaccharide/colanic/teichoic acid biosynthesis glycosyltransferase